MQLVKHWVFGVVLAGWCASCGGESSRLHTGAGDESGGAGSGGAGAAGVPVGGGPAAGGGGTAAGGAGGAGGAGAGGTASAGVSGGDVGGAGRAENGGASGGRSPQGGTGGIGGGGGAAGGAGGDATEGVRVIRGAPGDEFWDVTIRGVELDAYEGKTVLVRMGWPDRPPERLASGETQIAGGTFELLFPAAWEADLYKTKLVLIDMNGDRACDLSLDRLFQDSRATEAAELVVNGGSTAGRFDMHEVTDSFYCGWFNDDWPLE